MRLIKHIKMDLLGTDGGGGGTTPPTQSNQTTNNSTPPPNFDWGALKNALPEDLRNDPSLGSITSLEGLTKSYIHAQKAIGKERISIPDKHATEDDWRGVFSKLGVPEKLDDYKFKLPDGADIDETVLGKIKEVAHKKGVLPWQLESIVHEFTNVAKELNEKSENDYKMEFEAQLGALKKEWGQSFDTQIKKANIALKNLLPEVKDQEQFIKAVGSDNPMVLKVLAKAASLMKDDAFIGQGDSKLGGMTPAEALEKARAIQGDPNHPYRNPNHPNHKAAQEEVRKLYQHSFPE